MAHETRPYQTRLVNEIFEAWTPFDKVVLAADVGAGKTNMACDVIARLIQEKPDARVFVQTHGRKDVRRQFGDRLRLLQSDLDISVAGDGEGEEAYRKDAQVVVGLPQLHRKELTTYDLLIVDEAHHYYDAEDGMAEKLRSRITRQGSHLRQLLLTATPSKFIGRDDFKILTCSAQQMLLEGQRDNTPYFACPNVEYVEAYRKVTARNYTSDGHLREQGDLAADLPLHETRALVKTLIQRLTHTRKLPAVGNLLGQRRLFRALQLQKTLWIASSIDHANDLSTELERYYPTRVLLSHSDNDGASENLDRFIKDEVGAFLHLVVVDRATLAWDYPQLANLVDVSLTLNPEVRKQQMGRVTRYAPGVAKRYFVVTSPERKHVSDCIQQLTFWLFTTEGLTEYRGISSVRNRQVVIIGERELKDKTDREPRETVAGKPKRAIDATDYVIRFENPLAYLAAMRFDIGSEVIRWGGREVETYRKVSVNQVRAAFENLIIHDPTTKAKASFQWMTDKGTVPSKRSNDMDERTLGIYLGAGRTNGTLPVSVALLYDRLCPPKLSFIERSKKALRLMLKKGRLSAKSPNLEERSLAEYLRHGKKKEILPAAVAQEYARVMKRDSADERANKIISWCKINKRRPRCHAVDTVERKFARWMVEGDLSTPELDAHLSQYPSTRRLAGQLHCEQRFEQLVSWCMSSKRLPKHTAVGNERKLRVFLERMRRLGCLTPDHLARINAAVKGDS